MSIYVASRASIPERAAMWRRYRAEGVPIISSWIDEDGQGQTEDLCELWDRIEMEIKRSSRLVLYAEPEDFPLKGALIESGIAIGASVEIIVSLPRVILDPCSFRPLGSWVNHPYVTRDDDIDAVMNRFKR